MQTGSEDFCGRDEAETTEVEYNAAADGTEKIRAGVVDLQKKRPARVGRSRMERPIIPQMYCLICGFAL